MKPSAVVVSPVEAGFANKQTEVNASAKDATTSEVSAACTVQRGCLQAYFGDFAQCGLRPKLGTRGAEQGKPEGT